MAQPIRTTFVDDEPVFAREPEADPLHFLAGRRYTCYCGRTVVSTILCRECAEEMTTHFLDVARRQNSQNATDSQNG